MPGGGNFNIIEAVKSQVIYLFRNRQICTSPCDGLILKMHYRWTFYILLGIYSISWFNWFSSHSIICVSHFDADKQFRTDYLNICYSYSYVLNGHERQHILFYRWLPIVSLFLAGVYYIPHKLCKILENAKAKKLFDDLAANQLTNPEQRLVDSTTIYTIIHWKTHDDIYYKHLICNVIALVIDVFAFFTFDFIFRGRFLKYGIMTLPFRRDVEYFTDYMSKTFPPFVHCEIGPSYQLTNKRTEKIGCHLPMMELYEKIFFVLWYWLAILVCLTALYIVFLMTMRLPFVRRFLLKVSKARKRVPPPSGLRQMQSNLDKPSFGDVIDNLVHNCKIGDFFVLYKLKGFFSHVKFCELLVHLADPSNTKSLLTGISIESFDTADDNTQTTRKRYKKSKDSPPNRSILVDD